MITALPTHYDFRIHGEDYINLAWYKVHDLSTRHYISGDIEVLNDQDLANEDLLEGYQRELSSALMLCHQGIEFLLKGKIASVSPFLLISQNPDQWPRGSDKADTAFSEFRTIDAQDLLRVVNTVSATKISDTFAEKYSRLRKRRNAICHTVTQENDLTPKDLFLMIFDALREFFPDTTIAEKRREFLSRDISFRDEDEGEVFFRFATEMNTIIHLLSPSELDGYFSYPKNMRRYLCPFCRECSHYVPLEIPLAILAKKEPNCRDLYCMICDKHFEVIRKACNCTECKGNVIHASEEGEMCLTCRTIQGS